MTGLDLQEVKEQLAVGYCNPHWRQRVESLVAEVERLQELLDAIIHLVSSQAASQEIAITTPEQLRSEL